MREDFVYEKILNETKKQTHLKWERAADEIVEEVEGKSPLSAVLMRLNECKCVTRTKLRALINHSPGQQQECSRNALAVIVPPKNEPKLMYDIKEMK